MCKVEIHKNKKLAFVSQNLIHQYMYIFIDI